MKIFSPIFSSISFIVLGFIFRSVIHFELLLIHSSWYGLILSLSLLFFFFLVHGISQARILEWVAMPNLLQGIFPIRGLNPGLLHCRWILYHLCHQGSPWILEWVAIPYPGYHSDPGIELGSPALQADSLPSELPGKSPAQLNLYKILFIVGFFFFSNFEFFNMALKYYFYQLLGFWVLPSFHTRFWGLSHPSPPALCKFLLPGLLSPLPLFPDSQEHWQFLHFIL